jgi:hypothetical protein
MSDITQFMVTRVPNALFGSDTSSAIDGGSYPSRPVGGSGIVSNLRTIRGGTLTANTYKTLLSVTGSGVINFAALCFELGTQGAKMRVTVDGVQIAEITQPINPPNIPITDKMVPIIGSCTSDSAPNQLNPVGFDPVPFNSSCVIEAQSTTSTANAVGLVINYRTYP